MLETAFSFLFRKCKAVNGSALNSARHEFVISNGGCCLHCGKRLTRKNSNTEHIHDRALGGSNTSANKVIMCVTCNLARNKTMQMYLGSPSYWRGFPGNWDRVKKYLLWNAVTVDKGHNSGKMFPDVHNLFESIIYENGNTLNVPPSWFGRGNNTILIRENKGKRNLLIRFLDKIFGYENSSKPRFLNSENMFDVEEQIANERLKQKNSNKDVESKIQNGRERRILDLPREFYETILSALDTIEGEIKLATFSNYFQLYLVGKGLRKKSLKEFARSFGIPKNRTCVEIIEDYFPTEITYRREGETIVYISRQKQRVFQYLTIEEE